MGVLSTAEVRHVVLDGATFVLLGSDGIFEFLSDTETLGLAAAAATAQSACTAVVEAATVRWNQTEPTSTDDISCVVVRFK